MKTSLEYLGQPVMIKPNGRPADRINQSEIMLGKTLEICSWCDPKNSIEQSLTKAGYKLSHGVCEKHKQEFIDKMNYNKF
jgi:hypothetical protein